MLDPVPATDIPGPPESEGVDKSPVTDSDQRKRTIIACVSAAIISIVTWSLVVILHVQ